MSPKKKQILLVDDDPDIRVGLRDRLESFGFQVTTVPCGEEAVKEIERGGYAMAIMDVMMPNMDGIEALRIIRRTQQNIPVIMITSSLEKAQASISEGAQAYLLKPIDPKRLKETVDRWFPKNGSSSSVA